MKHLIPLFSYIAILGGAEIPEQVLICGVCKDVETRLESTKKIMESIGNLFDDYRILVYENNSTDHTAEILQHWVKTNPKVWVQSENLSKNELEDLIINVHSDGRLFVPEQIARARNIVLKEIFNPIYDDFPYVIWMDMDFLRFPNLEGFIDTFNSSQEWDAVFAYGIAPNHMYWDWYAFRDSIYPFGPELLGMDWFGMDRQLSLSEQDTWYPVYSAFGGCGIYKKSSIYGCVYSALATVDLETHFKKLMEQQNHPQILKYSMLNQQLKDTCLLTIATPYLPLIQNSEIGIVLQQGENALLWRMNSFVYQYPVVCEHVPFHASMILRGHDKLYINPKLVFRYGN